MGTDFICDQETGECIAFIRNGEIFRNRSDEEKIGTIRSGSVCDLQGNLVVHLDGDLLTGFRIVSLPASFKKLLNERLTEAVAARGSLKAQLTRELIAEGLIWQYADDIRNSSGATPYDN